MSILLCNHFYNPSILPRRYIALMNPPTIEIAWIIFQSILQGFLIASIVLNKNLNTAIFKTGNICENLRFFLVVSHLSWKFCDLFFEYIFMYPLSQADKLGRPRESFLHPRHSSKFPLPQNSGLVLRLCVFAHCSARSAMSRTWGRMFTSTFRE